MEKVCEKCDHDLKEYEISDGKCLFCGSKAIDKPLTAKTDAGAEVTLDCGVKPTVCNWHYDSGVDYEGWETDCGETFCLIDGGPHDNSYFFCPKCGGELIEM